MPELQPYEPGAFPVAARQQGERVADRIVTIAHRLGIRHAFGIIGGACATFADALGRSSMQVVQTRHEAGAAFSAVELSLATGQPALVFTTTGPGILNALNGLVAARWDGARVLVVSAATGPAHRRRLPVQETSSSTMPMDALCAAGPWFDFGALLQDPVELAAIENALLVGFGGSEGFVAHLSVPTPLQAQPAPKSRGPRPVVVRRSRDSGDLARSTAALLADGPFAVWVGAGANGAAREVRDLVERSNAPFMLSPRAKGTVSERHPHYLGVTGAGGHDDIGSELTALGIKRTLVLGSRLGEATSFYNPGLVPSHGFVHVDLDRCVFGAAYPDTDTVGIEAEIGAFVEELVRHIEHQTLPRRPRPAFPLTGPPTADEAAVHPRAVMAALQRVVVDGSNALVLSESGNAFGWANHHLAFKEPGRYRSSAAWGSMGHMVAGCIGAAVGSTNRSVVVITGDGAMLMNNEVNTAVQHGLPIVWVVLNDAGYGIVRDGMRALGLEPWGCDFPDTDFVAFASAQGATGVTVRSAGDLEAALATALAARRPFVLDVKTVHGLMSPAFVQRNASLTKAGKP